MSPLTKRMKTGRKGCMKGNWGIIPELKLPETALHVNDPHPRQNVQYVYDAPAHRRRKPTG